MAFHLKNYVFIPPPDELDVVLEREAIERYVTHIANGDRTSWALGDYWAEPRGVKHQKESHWDMETILANWAALFGAAPSAASLAVEPQPPDLTLPTVRLVASRPHARASGASSIRRSTVTTDQHTHRAANAIPNKEPDITTLTVEQIMRHRGVGRRYAYSLLRRAQEAKMDVPIPSNQRELILALLHQNGDQVRNTDILSMVVHDAGSKLPPHDVTKTLWSLQKSRYVHFRERANGMLYGIKLTPDGKKAAKALIHPMVVDDNELLPTDAGTMSTVEEPTVVTTSFPAPVVTNVGPDQQADAYDLIEEHVKRVAANAALLQEEINALGAGAPEPIAEWSINEWPELTKIRDRALRAQKLNAAAKLLEEAGEDDMVLTLMAKTEFTPLEQEIISLLRYFKEIE